jgi:hypothetical protein
VGQEEFCSWIWFWRASAGYDSKFLGDCFRGLAFEREG